LQGNLQIFYCADEVPIWQKLTLAQQSFWVLQYIGCFNPLFRTIFLLCPVFSIYTGISPYAAPLEESLYYFLPYMLFQLGTFSWSVNYTVSFFWNELYEIILCFPGLERLYFTLKKPFGKPFVVTPKGVTANRKRYNLNRTFPLLLLVVLTLIALALHIGGYWLGLWQTLQGEGFSIVFFWLVYNLIMVSVAIVAVIDQPERRLMDRFPLKTRCRLVSGDAVFWGYTHDLSEGGAQVVLTTPQSVPQSASVVLELPDYDFAIAAKLLRIQSQRQTVRLGLHFGALSIEHNRQLVEMLYTEVTWWKQDKRPGSLDAMLAMLWALVQLKPLRNRFQM
jgi:cellulose synthase (UDP-forming)